MVKHVETVCFDQQAKPKVHGHMTQTKAVNTWDPAALRHFLWNLTWMMNQVSKYLIILCGLTNRVIDWLIESLQWEFSLFYKYIRTHLIFSFLSRSRHHSLLQVSSGVLCSPAHCTSPRVVHVQLFPAVCIKLWRVTFQIPGVAEIKLLREQRAAHVVSQPAGFQLSLNI